MKKKILCLLSAFLSCIVPSSSIPIVLPISNANAATETTYQTITIEQLKSVQDFILGNSEGVTTIVDKNFDVNNDDRVDVFDLCILRQMYSEQMQKTDNFYSLSSEMIQDNDLQYGSSVMSDDFYSKRLIVKAKSEYDFSKFSPKSVISGFDNIYVVQFDDYENSKLCESALKKDTNIEYIEPDQYMKCEELTDKQISESNSWGVSAIEADKYAEYLGDNYNSSVVVSVVDSGVSSHSFLNGRILETGYDLVDNDPDPSDKNSHGTHVAGTVVDCTPELNVQIMPVRVLDSRGSGSYLNVGNGIRYAVEHGADVINLSLGGKSCSSYIDDSIEYAIENGVTVVVSAGNDNKNTKDYCPSHLDDCIVVVACDSEYKKATFSNYGDSVDVTAPGVNIKSCVPGGDYEYKNGTSMAAPHISAAVAMIKYADESATPAEIEQTLKDISLDLGDAGKDVYYGYGLPKLSKLIENDSPDVPIIDSGQCGDDVYYTLDENGLLTISGTGDMRRYASQDYVPWKEFKSEIKKAVIKKGITSIGNYAFYDCTRLKSVTIPNSVTNIAWSAFSGCLDLTSITIPDSVTRIENWAFDGCSGLTSITIPDSVTSIGHNAFSNTIWIENKRAENPIVIVNNILIDGHTCKGDIVIPDSVTSIEAYAFWACNSLTSVIIPDSVTRIGYASFYYCDKLKSIKILNPDCEIYGGTIDDSNTIIYGYAGSTTQAYAEKYNRTFVAID